MPVRDSRGSVHRRGRCSPREPLHDYFCFEADASRTLAGDDRRTRRRPEQICAELVRQQIGGFVQAFHAPDAFA